MPESKSSTSYKFKYIHCGYEWYSNKSSVYCKHCGMRLLGMLVKGTDNP